MRRAHTMPFGAELLDARRTRFALWAPGARAVSLELSAAADTAVPLARSPLPSAAFERSPMARLEGGWYELIADASAGTRYRFRIDDDLAVPDPASRFNPDGVHAASEIVDPAAFDWQDTSWRGRPWHDAVLYETHVGTFSRTGDFAGVERRLDELVDLGITAIELLPIGAFSGERGWGYDGVLWYAPHPAYGAPHDLKQLVQAAHARGLMMILDVVYNHFGPDGNYLPRYAPAFFTATHRTPWGDAINLDDAGSATVRAFIIENALYWLNEYHFDGLRLDAVHALHDSSPLSLVEELARAVQAGPAQHRHIHLVLENDRNEARRLSYATAQWNDDFHHAFHVLMTGERDGYYADYLDRPLELLARALAEGFVYQGEPSAFAGRPRGEPSAHLPPTSFVTFLQNHDQIGNRACGERLVALTSAEKLRAAWKIMLLAPSPPMLFMGEELGSAIPFLYFCDYSGELGRAVTTGRRREFARFAQFAGEHAVRIPDPCARETFDRSRLVDVTPDAALRDEVRSLLTKRRECIVPIIPLIIPGATTWRVEKSQLLVTWILSDDRRLMLHAKLGDDTPWQVHWQLGGRNVLGDRNPLVEDDVFSGRLV